MKLVLNRNSKLNFLDDRLEVYLNGYVHTVDHSLYSIFKELECNPYLNTDKYDNHYIDALIGQEILVNHEERGYLTPVDKTFANCELFHQSLDKKAFGIVGIPYDLGTFSPYSNSGARFAPADIRESSDIFGDLHTEIFDISSNKKLDISISDFGDITVLKPFMSHNVAHAIIKNHSNFVRKNCETPIYLGGDHSVTRSIVNSDVEYLLWFDAHTDYGDSNKHFHNCVLKNIVEENPGIKKIYCFGIRRFIPANEYNNIFESKKIEFVNINDISKIEMILCNIKGRDVHCSIDMDCFDPAYCPDVGYPMPNGLSLSQVEQFIFQLINVNLSKISFDFVESYHKPNYNSKSNITSLTVVYLILCIVSGKNGNKVN